VYWGGGNTPSGTNHLNGVYIGKDRSHIFTKKRGGGGNPSTAYTGRQDIQKKLEALAVVVQRKGWGTDAKKKETYRARYPGGGGSNSGKKPQRVWDKHQPTTVGNKNPRFLVVVFFVKRGIECCIKRFFLERCVDPQWSDGIACEKLAEGNQGALG